MSYYMAKRSWHTFEQALKRVQSALADEGFGILTEIDVQATLKISLTIRPGSM